MTLYIVLYALIGFVAAVFAYRHADWEHEEILFTLGTFFLWPLVITLAVFMCAVELVSEGYDRVRNRGSE